MPLPLLIVALVSATTMVLLVLAIVRYLHNRTLRDAMRAEAKAAIEAELAWQIDLVINPTEAETLIIDTIRQAMSKLDVLHKPHNYSRLEYDTALLYYADALDVAKELLRVRIEGDILQFGYNNEWRDPLVNATRLVADERIVTISAVVTHSILEL